ncbi:sulfatase [Alsobacter sp. SYSU M60028]|uniref:Sulfatase n=1 Tax=Alsobacter ponti TaxID=2962936 RepID=A0ABT1LC72_9HYPH|nr:sulfatase [Alsobacter ponti]MCP8939104.1 sulfatase [Alsobacter ponti]
MTRHPNLVVVLVDQLRRHALGFAGDPNVRTPNIDRLAAEGAWFDAACSSYPACVPFRFSLMTGEYAHSRNVLGIGHRLSPAERTLGEAVREQGYATAYVGKWHLYSSYGLTGGLTLSQACRTPVPRSHRRGFDAWRGFELRNDFHDTWYFRDDEATPRRLEGYQTHGLFDLAETYIADERPRDRPFFLLLSVEAPHPPFTAPAERVEAIAQRGPLRTRPNVDVGAIRFAPPEWYGPGNPGGAADRSDIKTVHAAFEPNMRGYYAMIEEIDDRMGSLMRTLETQGLAENTVVLFLSDHGELGGSHGLLGKAEPWEESVAIPLIAWGAGIAKGARCATPLATEDLFATLVGLAGGSPEPGPGRRDFAPWLRGDAPPPDREAVLLEFVAEARPGRGYFDRTWRGVRTARHKYVTLGDRTGARPWLLFDLEADPYELRNLVDDAGSAELAARMHGLLVAVLDETEDDYALAPAFGHPARRAVAEAS